MVNQNWWEWKYSVSARVCSHDNKTGDCDSIVKLKVNLLQVATICQYFQVVKLLTKIAEENERLDDILKEAVEIDNLNDVALATSCKWIKDATLVHLAARFHPESLSHFISLRPKLVNRKTKGANFSALHVAASLSSSLCCSFLIKNDADIEAKTMDGLTPLHIAAMLGSTDNVKALLFEGRANALSQAKDHLTPLHLSDDGDIINLLLQSGITISQILSIEIENAKSNEKEEGIFEMIVKNHPISIGPYLDLMITSNSKDKHANKQTLIYDLSIFKKTCCSSKSNQLDYHLDLINFKQSTHLNHPIMRLFSDMKWHMHRSKYLMNLFLFTIFLMSFTFYAYHYVKLARCKELTKDDEIISNDTICYKAVNDLDWIVCPKNQSCNISTCKGYTWKNVENETVGLEPIVKCLEKLDIRSLDNHILHYSISKYITLGSLSIIGIWELCQFVTKCIAHKPLKHFNLQNNIEILIIITSITSIALENVNVEICRHFLGWALFLSWWNLTLILGRFDIFGRNIYLAWHVMSDVAWSLVVYIPSFVAFACSFYCFWIENEALTGFLTSTIQILMMMIGELEVPKEGSFNMSFKVTFCVLSS